MDLYTFNKFLDEQLNSDVKTQSRLEEAYTSGWRSRKDRKSRRKWSREEMLADAGIPKKKPDSYPSELAYEIVSRVKRKRKPITDKNLWQATQEIYDNLKFQFTTGKMIDIDSLEQLKKAFSIAKGPNNFANLKGIFFHDNVMKEPKPTASYEQKNIINTVKRALFKE